MKRDDYSVLASGCLTEAIVFRGCTTAEMVTLCVVGLALWAPVLLVVGIMIDSVMMSLGFLLVAVGLTVFIGGTVLQKWKRGRPEGYYRQVAEIYLGKRKMIRNKFIVHDGEFTLGRTHRVARISEGSWDE